MKLIGTIIKVKDLLCNDETSIGINITDNKNKLITMPQNRKYIIPDFQREIRWKEENLIELLDDIKKRSKFLGNIILSKTQSGDFEVIDGQQRISLLIMIMKYVSKYSKNFDIFSTCQLEVMSFEGFDHLMRNEFSFDGLNQDLVDKIKESDYYKQIPQYIKLWNTIKTSKHLKDEDTAEDLITNLKRSELNVIINDEPDDYSMEYFLDVNLKGIRLDSEDIFKAVLFSRDSGPEIRNLWRQLKQKHEQILNAKINFPLMTNLEHCFYVLLINTPYETLRFDSNFKTTDDIELNKKYYHKGEHVLNVIVNKTFSLNVVRFAVKLYDFMIQIVNSNGPDVSFKELIKSKAAMNNVEIEILYFFMKNIIKEKNSVPKLLLIRYLKENIFVEGNVTKTDLRSLYTIVFYSILFTLFKTRKDIRPVIKIVMDEAWIESVFRECKTFLSSKSLPKRVLTTQFYELDSDENFEDELSFKCKMIAIYYNYFKLDESNCLVIKNGETNNLLSMIKDNTKYSVEHFALNKSKNVKIDESVNIELPNNYQKFINNTFNFIFIPNKLNNDLENFFITKKVEMLKTSKSKITCAYSLAVIEIAEKNFQHYSSLTTKDEWEIYFKISFESEYFNYVQAIIEILSNRWLNLKENLK